MVVVGIEDIHQVPGQVLLLYCLAVVALVEGIQLEAAHGLRIPHPQGVDDAIAISHDRHVVGDGLHRLVVLLHIMVPAVLIGAHGDIAAEFHLLGILRSAQLEGIALRQPVVRNLYLETVLNLLLEQAVAVADAAAISGISKGGQGIQETCRQPSQSAVAQRRVGLLVFQHIDVHTQLLKDFLRPLVGLEVYHVVAQRAAHEEFHGHIVHHLGVFPVIGFLGVHPVADDPVLDRIGSRLENLLGSGLLQCLAVHVHDIIQDTPLEKLLVERGLLLRGFRHVRLRLCFRRVRLLHFFLLSHSQSILRQNSMNRPYCPTVFYYTKIRQAFQLLFAQN